MTDGEEKRRLAEIEAPYGRHVRLDEIVFDSGMRLMRVTIREGRRITVLDVDADTARAWARAMAGWADGNAATWSGSGKT